MQQALAGLTAMRERVSDPGSRWRSRSASTRLVTELLAVVDGISVDSRDATIALQTNAYAAFLQSKGAWGWSGRP